MNVSTYMTRNPITVTKYTNIYDAKKIMEDHNIRRLPVLGGNRLAGIVSKTDILEASPPDLTKHSIHELNYILSRMIVSEVMTKHPLTVSPDTPIEIAAKLMRKYKIASLPVLEEGELVGIITESDLFDAFIEIMGGHISGSKIILTLEDKPGALANATHIISRHNANIISVVTTRRGTKEGESLIAIKIDREDASDIVEEMREIGIAATFRFENPV
jgi:acetoin utilization protein AcuB